MQLAGTKKTGNWLWDTLRSPEMIMPGGAIFAPMKIGTKVALAATAIGATAAFSYFQKNGIGQTQKQAAATGGYTITAQPGSTVNIEKPTTGAIEQAQTAQAVDTGGIMSILMVAAVVVVLMMFKK